MHTPGMDRRRTGDKWTSLRVRASTRSRLEYLKIIPSESFDLVIRRIIEVAHDQAYEEAPR